MYVLKRNTALLWWFWISFLFVLSRPVHTMQLVSYDSLYYYAETKEMIDESVNLKGVVYEPKHNSFSLQCITILLRSFIKLIFWSQTSFQLNWIENLFRVQCIDISEIFTILRGSLSTIGLRATRFCKARGRLVLQIQGLSFLEKLDFRFFHKNSC